jgi:uncharacterized repeat protein (TIGR02543 family)
VTYGGSATFTAAPAANYVFRGWSGTNCTASTSNPYTITPITSNVTCTPSYVHRITITGAVAGAPTTVTASSTDPNKSCTTSACTIDDPPGQVTLTAPSVAGGYTFTGWTGGAQCPAGLAQTVTVTSTSNVTCTANYAFTQQVSSPIILTKWIDPSGWIDHAGMPVAMTFASTGAPNTVFECRTGPRAVIGSMAFTTCTVATNVPAPNYAAAPVASQPDGSYETDVRIHINSYISGTTTYTYYAHSSLNKALICNPQWTDSQYFAAAQNTVVNSVLNLKFDVATAFPSLVTANPFVSLTFLSPSYNIYAVKSVKNAAGALVDPTPATAMTITPLTLRHRFVTDTTTNAHMILIRRQYDSRRRHAADGVTESCENGFKLGWDWIKGNGGGTRAAGSPARRTLDCKAMVMNAHGQGICFADGPNGPTELAFTDTAWIKLLGGGDHDEFSPKTKNNCGANCGTTLYLPQ